MKRQSKRLFIVVSVLFIGMNVIAAFHAYKFTHFSSTTAVKTRDAAVLDIWHKLSALLFGISNPRPADFRAPSKPYQTVKLKSNKEIECWLVPHPGARGTVILFHGFSSSKSGVVDISDEFYELGYSILLVDFMGSGGSEGNQTTIGFKEAQQVKTAYEYIKSGGERNVVLFGCSMGAVAIIKAINDFHLKPEGIIIECPFGTMYKTTCSRFRQMGIPSFPMAALLDVWGGIENGFNPFAFSPEEYAKTISCPTLLHYGGKDDKVSLDETRAIYNNLAGDKQLVVYPLAGHENYLDKYRAEWVQDVSAFLMKVKPSF